MNLWEYLGCQDDEEKAQFVRDVSNLLCPSGDHCSPDMDCQKCWHDAIDRVKEVKLYGECENHVNDD